MSSRVPLHQPQPYAGETTTDTGGHATRDRPRGTVIRDTWTVTKRNLRRITRTPRLLLVSSIQPILYVLLFRFVFGGSLVIPGMTYIDYLLPGIFVTATLMGATTAVAITTDLSGGMIDRFRSLPMARSAVLAGRCLADLVRCVLVVAIVLVIGTVLGFRFHAGPLPALGAIGLVLAAAFAFIWLYALIGLLVKDPETSHLAGFLIVMPFVFASSVFVRVQNMPGWLQIFSQPTRDGDGGCGPGIIRRRPRRHLRLAISSLDRRIRHLVRMARRLPLPAGLKQLLPARPKHHTDSPSVG